MSSKRIAYLSVYLHHTLMLTKLKTEYKTEERMLIKVVIGNTSTCRSTGVIFIPKNFLILTIKTFSQNNS